MGSGICKHYDIPETLEGNAKYKSYYIKMSK